MSGAQRPTTIQAAQRGIWFFMRTILLALALVFIGYGVFNTARHASSLYILATEGLQLRARCILRGEVTSELNEYFTEQFIADDNDLKLFTYGDYTVSGYDYRIEVESISVTPWSDTATVTLVDRMVQLSGTIHEDKKPENAPEDAVYPLPEWPEARYRMRFRLEGDRWYVYQLQRTGPAPSEAPKRTPDMRLSPRPAHTATPTPSATPTPTSTPTPTPTAMLAATPTPAATPDE